MTSFSVGSYNCAPTWAENGWPFAAGNAATINYDNTGEPAHTVNITWTYPDNGAEAQAPVTGATIPANGSGLFTNFLATGQFRPYGPRNVLMEVTGDVTGSVLLEFDINCTLPGLPNVVVDPTGAVCAAEVAVWPDPTTAAHPLVGIFDVTGGGTPEVLQIGWSILVRVPQADPWIDPNIPGNESAFWTVAFGDPIYDPDTGRVQFNKDWSVDFDALLECGGTYEVILFIETDFNGFRYLQGNEYHYEWTFDCCGALDVESDVDCATDTITLTVTNLNASQGAGAISTITGSGVLPPPWGSGDADEQQVVNLSPSGSTTIVFGPGLPRDQTINIATEASNLIEDWWESFDLAALCAGGWVVGRVGW